MLELVKERIDSFRRAEQRVALPPAGVPVVVQRPQTRRADVAQPRDRQAHPLGPVVLVPRRPPLNDDYRPRILLAFDANLTAGLGWDALGAQFAYPVDIGSWEQGNIVAPGSDSSCRA